MKRDNLNTIKLKTLDKDLIFIREAISQANRAQQIGEVPVGCVVVDNNQNILSSSYNQKEKNKNPCAHAEILALTQAAQKRGDWRLTGCSLFVSLEPCLMCLSAMISARISRLVFSAYDFKAGALSLGYHFYRDRRLNHNFEVLGGIEAEESSQILSKFFQNLRS